MKLILPWPPSLNRIWRSVVINGRPRVLLSAAGREYRKSVQKCIGYVSPIQDHVFVKIFAHPPDNRRRDADNLPKIVFDSLTHAGIWVDDSQVIEFYVKKCLPSKDARLEISIDTYE